MSRFGGYGGPHSANGSHFHHHQPPPAPYAGMYDRFERGFDSRHGFYGDFYGGCYPGGPSSYPGGPGRYEPYGAPPGRLGGDRRAAGGVRPKPAGGPAKGAGGNVKSGSPAAKKVGGGRRPSGKRTSAVQFTASRSRLKPPFVISQSKWGNSNRSSWIFPRFGDYIDTQDTPIWLTPDDLVTKFEVPPDNQYCSDCGVLIINLKRHKASDIHRETLEEKKGQTPKWKLEFMERKRKYEERKAQGGKGDDNQDDKDEGDDDGNGAEDDDEEEETAEGDIEEELSGAAGADLESRNSEDTGRGSAEEELSGEGAGPHTEAMEEAMETAEASSGRRQAHPTEEESSTCNGSSDSAGTDKAGSGSEQEKH